MITEEQKTELFRQVNKEMGKFVNGYMSPRTPEEQAESDKPKFSIYEMNLPFPR